MGEFKALLFSLCETNYCIACSLAGGFFLVCVRYTVCLFGTTASVRKTHFSFQNSCIIQSCFFPQEVDLVKNDAGAEEVLTEVASGEAGAETGEDSEAEEAETEAALDQEKWIRGKGYFSGGYCKGSGIGI